MLAALVSALASVALTLAPPQLARQEPTAPPAATQDPDPSATSLPDVVVDGRTLDTLARDFIDEITAPANGVGMARWPDRICVGVVNLNPETSRFVIDRVSAVALEVGLEPGLPGCEPHVIILATVDGGRVAQALVDRHRHLLAPSARGFSRGRRALQAFADSDKAVRWWHLSASVNPDTGQNTVRMPRMDPCDGSMGCVMETASVRVTGSLLSSTTRQDLRRAIIIVDFAALDGIDFDQLADYLAFISLAQVDPEADTASYDTILNVFDDPAATQGLTDWDRAYLRGLYQSDDRARGANTRAGALRREMLRARAPTTTPDPSAN